MLQLRGLLSHRNAGLHYSWELLFYASWVVCRGGECSSVSVCLSVSVWSSMHICLSVSVWSSMHICLSVCLSVCLTLIIPYHLIRMSYNPNITLLWHVTSQCVILTYWWNCCNGRNVFFKDSPNEFLLLSTLSHHLTPPWWVPGRDGC